MKGDVVIKYSSASPDYIQLTFPTKGEYVVKVSQMGQTFQSTVGQYNSLIEDSNTKAEQVSGKEKENYLAAARKYGSDLYTYIKNSLTSVNSKKTFGGK